MKTSTKWMVDVINLSNSTRHHVCHKKSEHGSVLNKKVNNLLSEFLFLSHADFLVALFQRIDRK